MSLVRSYSIFWHNENHYLTYYIFTKEPDLFQRNTFYDYKQIFTEQVSIFNNRVYFFLVSEQ